MKTLIYARQSSGDDEKSESVDVQLAKIREYAMKNGLEVTSEHSDLNTSGKTYPAGASSVAELDQKYQKWYQSQTKAKKYRDGLGRLLDEADEGDTIIVYDLTRLYRPVTGSFLESYIRQRLEEKHLVLHTVTDGKVDLAHFATAVVTSITNMTNDLQISLARKKAMASRQAMRMKGQVACGKAPTGWRYAGLGKFVQVPEEQEEMRYAFKAFIDGVPRAEIVRQVNAMRKRRGYHKLLSQSGLDRLYKKPVFCGLMTNPEGNLIPIAPGQYELPWPVSQEDWYRVQTMLAGPGVGPQVKYSYALTGFVRCGFCGKNLVQNGSHKFCGKGVYDENPASRTHRMICKTALLTQGYTPCSQSHVVYSSNPVPEVGYAEDDSWRSRDLGVLEEHWRKAMLISPMEPTKMAPVGLYEAIMPLLAPAMVKRISELADENSAKKRVLELRFTLEQNARKRREIAKMVAEDLMTASDAKSSLEALKTREISIREDLARAEAAACSCGENAAKEARHRLYEIQQGILRPRAYREILSTTVDVVESYASCVRIYLENGGTLEIPKMAIRNKIAMPQYTISAIPLTTGGYRFEVRYFLHTFFGKENDDTETTVYHDDFLDVITVGRCRLPGESNSGRGGKAVQERLRAIEDEKKIRENF